MLAELPYRCGCTSLLPRAAGDGAATSPTGDGPEPAAFRASRSPLCRRRVDRRRVYPLRKGKEIAGVCVSFSNPRPQHLQFLGGF